MKNSIFSLILALFATAALAQEKPAPAKEFSVELSAPSLEIKPGQTKNVTVTLNRSKGFAKSNATLGLLSGLPEGVTVTFEPAEGVITNSVATIAVAETTKAGNYMIIFKGTLQHKSKGATLKLAVTDGATEVVSKN